MIRLKAISALFVFLMLFLFISAPAMGLTGEDMGRRIETYLDAKKTRDYTAMAGLLGVGEEELRQAVGDHLEYLKSYFAERLNLQLKDIRYGKHHIIFARPGRDEAFVGQEAYIYFEDSHKLRRQHEYSLFRVLFDERGHMRWQPLGSSRGYFEDIGRKS